MTYGVVMFGADWCGPCKSTKPALRKVCEELGLAYDYVDAEYGDTRAMGITGIPTIRVYDENAEIVREHRGMLPEKAAREFLADLPE
ncbi:thioredoxin family protein [Kitasatospora griseola]|uniref:thioredoxin family protein n=1 Tax=Kitasatospora griseola TaxID=2064 RepID=UPI0005C5F317|nr:thioredoxin family protein [Kitasatospora griseola]